MLTHALEKVRARDGLTHSRLDNSRSVEAAPILGLPAVRRSAVHNIELAQAPLDVVKECVRETSYLSPLPRKCRLIAGVGDLALRLASTLLLKPRDPSFLASRSGQ